MDNFESQKKEIELSLSRTLLTQLQKQKITFEECRQISSYILLYLNDITNPEDLYLFLEHLSKQWDIFETVSGFYRLHRNDTQDLNKKVYQGKNFN